MSAQQHSHDKQIAKFVTDAADRQAFSDTQMAKANLEAGCMQLAFDKLTSDNVAQLRTSALVSFGSVNSSMNSHFTCKLVLSWRPGNFLKSIISIISHQ